MNIKNRRKELMLGVLVEVVTLDTGEDVIAEGDCLKVLKASANLGNTDAAKVFLEITHAGGLKNLIEK
jgi:hypothetical protein